jgi:hypothetical protein
VVLAVAIQHLKLTLLLEALVEVVHTMPQVRLAHRVKALLGVMVIPQAGVVEAVVVAQLVYQL